MGNTLEKPGIILVRNRLGETTESQEAIHKGGEFERVAKEKYCEVLRQAEVPCPPPKCDVIH